MKFKNITVYEDPRKGSVKRVQNLRNNWILKRVPLEKMDMKMTYSEMFNECIKKDPVLLCEFLEFQQDVKDAQEIMLATVLTYDDVKRLEDQLSVKEFEELVNTCKEATGGIEGFFGESGSDTNSKNLNQPENNESMNSPDQPGGSTQE